MEIIWTQIAKEFNQKAEEERTDETKKNNGRMTDLNTTMLIICQWTTQI